MTWELRLGDCVAVLATIADESIDAVVTDPPYELGFMGKKWDASGIAYSVPMWSEVLRVLKPGGHLLAFGGTRTYHRMACAIEDAGFEIRDSIHWLYGTGFPKSLNLSDGRGTALKPAHEPIVLARRPLDGTVAANVLKHGTGALNIDACRIDGVVENRGGWCNRGYQRPRTEETFTSGSPVSSGLSEAAGRWPANVILDEETAKILDEKSLADGMHSAGAARDKMVTRDYDATSYNLSGTVNMRRLGDSGGASRFFYVAKPGSSERDLGLDHLRSSTGGEATNRMDGSDGLNSPRAGAGRRGGRKNIHPTVKPVSLMRYLCRLVTPPGGVVLDHFMGSGTTGIAALIEGFRFIGIEREPEYLEIARARIDGDCPLFNRSAR